MSATGHAGDSEPSGAKALRPAGWYPDPVPGHIGADRYWDGGVWTDRVRVRDGDTWWEQTRSMPGTTSAAARSMPMRAVILLVTVLVVGLLVYVMRGSGQSWGPSVPVGKTVSATVDDVWKGDVDKGTSVGPGATFASNGVYGLGSAKFTVVVESIRCGSRDCEIQLRIRNEGDVPAQYRCEQTEATDSAGERYFSLAAGLGNTVSGCDATTMYPPQQWQSVPVKLFYVEGKTLQKLQIPGDGSIDLPPTD
jgi:hypothetical protein